MAARFSIYKVSIYLPCYFAQVGASRMRNVPKILAFTICPPERGPSSIRLPRYAHHWPPNQDPRSVGPRRAATANMFAAGWLRTRAAPGRRLSFFSGRPVFTRQRGTHTKPAGEPRPNPLCPTLWVPARREPSTSFGCRVLWCTRVAATRSAQHTSLPASRRATRPGASAELATGADGNSGLALRTSTTRRAAEAEVEAEVEAEADAATEPR